MDKLKNLSICQRTLFYYVRLAEQRFLVMIVVGVVMVFYMSFILNHDAFSLFYQDSKMATMYIIYLSSLLNMGYGFVEYEMQDQMVISFGGKRKDIFWGGLLLQAIPAVECMIVAGIFDMIWNNSTFDMNLSLLGILIIFFVGSFGRIIGTLGMKIGKIIYILGIVVGAVVGNMMIASGTILNMNTNGRNHIFILITTIIALICAIIQLVQYRMMKRVQI